MNVIDVQSILNELFEEELTNDRDRHIIFWYDEAAEFIDEVDKLELDGVRILKFSAHNLFATKYELEVNDLTSHFLLYTNSQKPAPREDWLFNLYKLGSEFTADKITIFMRKLGLEDDRLRPVFMEYGQFFNSNARFESFRKYPVDVYTEESIDLNVLSVLTRSRINTMDEILKALFASEQSGEYEAWKMIKKFGNEEKFWALVEKYYGYTLEEKSLQSLLTFFMMTYVTEQNVDINYPKTWTEFVSPRPTNAIVFMNQWMNHRKDRLIFNALSDQISHLSKIEMHIKEWDIHELSAFDAFRIFDERIIEFIADQLTNKVGHYEDYEELIMKRRKKHWYPEYKDEYEALMQAAIFFELVDKLDQFIPEEQATTIFHSYVNTYYKLDTYYRKFYIAYDNLTAKEPLRNVRELLESTYTNWFVQELAIKWVSGLERAGDSWFLPQIKKQSDFYDEWVKSYVDNDQRVFVIISDALRFEVAKELMETLNSERKASTELTAVQGVLPSYTALGMASLLPHKSLTISNDGEVFVDGIRASSTKNRNTILQKYETESVAFTFEELSAMGRASLREACSGLKVVYIYHNAIDAIGDNPATERDVFSSTENAMNDISVLINRLVNNLSASNILITADHGFVYQRDKLNISQLTSKQTEDSIITNRRFILSEKNNQMEGTLSYRMDEMLQDEQIKYVTVPKGANRFQVQGSGANFVHGGAMLQEIVIPVITFKNDRSKSNRHVVRHVDVKLTSPTRKITSEEMYVEFFQTSAIEEKTLPLHLRAYFVDEDGDDISNECRIIADSKADEAYERTWKERFIFKSISYDRTKNYYLILEDENGAIYERYPFTIDIIPIV